MEYLIQHKADPALKDKKGFTPVHYAVTGRNLKALNCLITAIGGKCTLYGPDMPLTTPLHLAVSTNGQEMSCCKSCTEKKTHFKWLQLCFEFQAKNGSLDILQLILPYFPDPNVKNEQGSTPLLLAAREGHTHCVQMLLRFGAKVGICDGVSDMSPVHISAKNGHLHCLALLLDNTEDKSVINKPDKWVMFFIWIFLLYEDMKTRRP